MKKSYENKMVDGPCPKCGRPLHEVVHLRILENMVKSGENIKSSVNLMIMKVIG